MLRMTLPVTLPVITETVNQCINSCVLLNSWKLAKVEAYPDLRPINVLPVFSKVVEHIVCTQFTKYLENEELLPEVQSGFRAGHSAETALTHITDDMIQTDDNGLSSILVLLDFSKAFD